MLTDAPMLLWWPWHPISFSVTWDLIEMVFFLVLVALFLSVAALIAKKSRSAVVRFMVVALVAAAAWETQRFAQTLCYAVVPNHTHIEAVPELQPAELSRMWDIRSQGLPFVIRGALKEEVERGRFTPQALAELVGDYRMEVQIGNVEQNQTALEMISLEDFMEDIENPEYIAKLKAAGGKMPYFAESDDLFESAPLLALYARRLLRELKLHEAGMFHYQTLFWIGPEGTRTGMHYDVDALNLLCQMYGSKTLYLYPMEQTKWIPESDKFDSGASLALVDHFDPDFEKFPEFAKAKPIEVTINEGDVLFVPPHWYHAALSRSTSISVSLRMFTFCEAMALAPYSVLDILHEWGLYRHGDCVCHDAALSPY